MFVSICQLTVMELERRDFRATILYYYRLEIKSNVMNEWGLCSVTCNIL